MSDAASAPGTAFDPAEMIQAAEDHLSIWDEADLGVMRLDVDAREVRAWGQRDAALLARIAALEGERDFVAHERDVARTVLREACAECDTLRAQLRAAEARADAGFRAGVEAAASVADEQAKGDSALREAAFRHGDAEDGRLHATLAATARLIAANVRALTPPPPTKEPTDGAPRHE